MEPFGGRFAAHRAGLGRIKAASWRRASAHSAESFLDSASSRPRPLVVLSGPGVCRVCSHRSNWAVPLGRPPREMRCPRCGLFAVELAGTDYGPDDTPGSLVD